MICAMNNDLNEGCVEINRRKSEYSENVLISLNIELCSLWVVLYYQIKTYNFFIFVSKSSESFEYNNSSSISSNRLLQVNFGIKLEVVIIWT